MDVDVGSHRIGSQAYLLLGLTEVPGEVDNIASNRDPRPRRPPSPPTRTLTAWAYATPPPSLTDHEWCDHAG